MDFDTVVIDGMSLTKRQEEVLKIYRERHKANEHKMGPIPVCKLEDILP